MKFETRSLDEPAELHGEGTNIVARGRAVKYGERSRVLMNDRIGAFREEIRSGTFARHLGNPQNDVLALREHDVRSLLGRTSNGTLTIFDDAGEMRYEMKLPDTQAGRDAAADLETRSLKGSSFHMRVKPGGASWTAEDGVALRSVSSAGIHDISLVAMPAYEQTTAEVSFRSMGLSDAEVRSLLEITEEGHLAELIAFRSAMPEQEFPGGSEDLNRLAVEVRTSIDACRSAFLAGKPGQAEELLAGAEASTTQLLALLGATGPGNTGDAGHDQELAVPPLLLPSNVAFL